MLAGVDDVGGGDGAETSSSSSCSSETAAVVGVSNLCEGGGLRGPYTGSVDVTGLRDGEGE